MPAPLATEANVRAHPHHLPLVASARMRFAHAHDIAQTQIRQHVPDYTVAAAVPTGSNRQGPVVEYGRKLAITAGSSTSQPS
jgi:hypothetical protein